MDHATISLGGVAGILVGAAQRSLRLSAWLGQAANDPRRLGDSHGLRLRGAWLRIRHLAHLGVRPGQRPKQRKVWDTVKRGQEIALETAKIDVPVGAIDDAVRKYYESQGWGPGYRLPGLSHRTGHGIGLDGHEPPYLVHGDATPLQAGMCFSDEPGIYIPGEFGIRLEDCWYMTASGPKLFTPLAKSLEQPI